MKPSELSKALRDISNKIQASRRPNRILIANDLKIIINQIDEPKVRISSLTFVRPLANLSKNYILLSWGDASWLVQVLEDLGVDIEIQDLQGPDGDYIFNEDYANTISERLSKALANGEIGGETANEDPMGRTTTKPVIIPAVGGGEPLPVWAKELLQDLLHILSAPAIRT